MDIDIQPTIYSHRLYLLFKERKVFTIVGPYHGLRRSLRKRGWVEKFLKAPHPSEIVTSKKALGKNLV